MDRTLGITAGDFNDDGVLDIVAGNFATTNKMHFGVLSGTPSPQSPPPPSPVDLGTAGNFVILSKAGITNVAPSVVTGNVGVSPIAATAMTGWALVYVPGAATATSSQVDGLIYAADYAVSAAMLTVAVLDMQAAYTDAMGRLASTPANLNVLAGLVGGYTFTAGTYVWISNLAITADIYIKGNPDDVFIFRVVGIITSASHVTVHLVADGTGNGCSPLASNIIWVCSGYIAAGTYSHLEGIFLTYTAATWATGSSLNGRIFAQTATALQMATIKAPTITSSSLCDTPHST
jgi:hypothetical protein